MTGCGFPALPQNSLGNIRILEGRDDRILGERPNSGLGVDDGQPD